MIINKTNGLIAAPYTPFLANGEINTSVLGEYARRLKLNGLKGVFVCGSTGEGPSLSVSEREIITEEWLFHQSSEFKIFVHVGANSVKDSCRLASHAEKHGAFAVSATGPSYFKPANVKILVDFMQLIASSAPKTPFYYYHIPGLNQNYLSIVEFTKLALEHIPTLSGVKYTHEDEMEFQLIRQESGGQLDVLYGRDETLICGLVLGATGGVGSTYNFMPGIYYGVIENFNKGNLQKANDLQLKSMKVIELYGKYGGVPAGKVIMKELGLDFGNPRLPIVALSQQQKKDLVRELNALSFFTDGLK